MLPPPPASSLSSPTASPQQPGAFGPCGARPDGAASTDFRDRVAERRAGPADDGAGTAAPAGGKPAASDPSSRPRPGSAAASGPPAKRANAPGRDRDGHRARHPPLLARPDGTVVVTGLVPPLLPTAAPVAAPRRQTGSAGLDTGGSSDARSAAARAVALADVRVGGAPGAAQLHATLAEGRHAGVELRAVERNGRVAIELLAPGPAEARALRAEMAEVREALAARGLDGAVTVDVRTDLDDRGRDGRREPEVPALELDACGRAPRGPDARADANEPSDACGDDEIVL